MPLLLLLVLAIACFPESWPQPLAWLGMQDGQPLLFAALTWLGVSIFVARAAHHARETSFRLKYFTDQRERIYQRHLRWRRRQMTLLCVFYLLAVFVLGWGWTVQNVCSKTVLQPAPRLWMYPGAELLIMAPLLVTMILSWVFYYDAERTLHRTASPLEALTPYWSRGAYVRYHLRQSLALIAAPLLLLVLEKGFRRLFPGMHTSQGVPIFSIVTIVLMFVGLPFILRLAIGAKPLPAGALRDRLEACSRRLRFHCNNILLWNTHNSVANAMVAGFFPFLRYVFLSDRLTQELTPEEVEAVFGHEVGHVKHRHMQFYLAFLILSLGVVANAGGLLLDALLPAPAQARELPSANAADEAEATASMATTNWSAEIEGLEVVPLLMMTGAYIFVVFGFLSRRCERQADVYGCRAVSCTRSDCAGHEPTDALAPHATGLCPTGIRIFIDALEKVAHINGISRSRPGWMQSWQHSTIARRVEFLQRILIDPGLEPRFQRTVNLVKWGLLLLVVAAYCLLGLTQGWEKVSLF